MYHAFVGLGFFGANMKIKEIKHAYLIFEDETEFILPVYEVKDDTLDGLKAKVYSDFNDVIEYSKKDILEEFGYKYKPETKE